MSTKRLAQFTAGLRYADLSPQTVTKTKQCILDWLGVCIRGSQEKPIKIIRELLLNGGGKGEASVLAGQGARTTALQAAFCNGAASHALDFDDLHNPSIIHLATVVVP
ncbi:MAG: MmgE/PrpD family protein, partial [Acidaminococcaceae bacterium]